MTVPMTVRGHSVPYQSGTLFPTPGTLFPSCGHAVPQGTWFPSERWRTGFPTMRHLVPSGIPFPAFAIGLVATPLGTLRGMPCPTLLRPCEGKTLGELRSMMHSVPHPLVGMPFLALQPGLARSGKQQTIARRAPRPAALPLDQAAVQSGEGLGHATPAELGRARELTEGRKTLSAMVVGQLRKCQQHHPLGEGEAPTAPSPVPRSAAHVRQPARPLSGPRAGPLL
jgi:hypothetical protein